MHDNFITLEREKRDRIINAAMHEFSSKGFKDASTNEIVKKAEISKGALFHYFSSKQDLFEFLYRYSMDFFVRVTEPRIQELPADVFERWISFASLKIEIASQYPDMAYFMRNVYIDDAPEISKLLKSEFERFSVALQKKMYDGIDLSKFKSELDLNKTLQIVWWVLEGFAVSKTKDPVYLSKVKTDKFIQSLIDEMKSYLDMLKKSFYKEEYLE